MYYFMPLAGGPWPPVPDRRSSGRECPRLPNTRGIELFHLDASKNPSSRRRAVLPGWPRDRPAGPVGGPGCIAARTAGRPLGNGIENG